MAGALCVIPAIANGIPGFRSSGAVLIRAISIHVCAFALNSICLITCVFEWRCANAKQFVFGE